MTNSASRTAAENFLFDAEDRICRAIDQITAVLALLPRDAATNEQSAAFRFADDVRDELRGLAVAQMEAFEHTFNVGGEANGGTAAEGSAWDQVAPLTITVKFDGSETRTLEFAMPAEVLADIHLPLDAAERIMSGAHAEIRWFEPDVINALAEAA